MRTNVYTVLLFTAVILSNFLGAISAPIPSGGTPESLSVAREAHEGTSHQDHSQTPRWGNYGEGDSFSNAGSEQGEGPPDDLNRYTNQVERILVKKDSDFPSTSEPVRRSRVPRDRSNDIPAKRSPSVKGAQQSDFDISGFANNLNTTLSQPNTVVRNKTTPVKTPAHAKRDGFDLEEWEEESIGVQRSVDDHVEPGTTSGAHISKKEVSGNASGTRATGQPRVGSDSPDASTSQKGSEGSTSGGSSGSGNGKPRVSFAPGPVKLARAPSTTETA